MKNAFDATVEIVTAKMTSSTMSMGKETGKHAAEFFEQIYNKLSEIQNAAVNTAYKE